MIEVQFPKVNKKILRSGTDWRSSVGFITEKTMSGKKKRRPSLTQTKKSFSVSMRFSVEEYAVFDDWWENICRKGLYPFKFQRIDGLSGERLYQFTEDGAPAYSNPSGDMIDVSMEWEEV